ERGFGASAAQAVAERFEASLEGFDVIIASDYTKGALGEMPRLIAAARQAGIPLLIDPKGRDFMRYQGAWALTPNRGEFEAVVGVCATAAELAERGERLRR